MGYVHPRKISGYFSRCWIFLVSIIALDLSWWSTAVSLHDPIPSMRTGGIIMDHTIVQPSSELSVGARQGSPSKSATVPPTSHPVLSRLMEEVRNERNVEARYDRVHNRHNRGR